MSAPGAPGVVSIPDVPFSSAHGPLLLDIIRPDPVPDSPMPVVIYIHGGGWMWGDRRENRSGVLAPHGFFTISIDYRLSHQAIFPAQIEDAKTAVRWVRAHAAHYHLDPSRIGVWGHSAGAHLAALLGTSAGVAELEGTGEWAGHSCRVQAVATLAAPTDFLCMGGWHDDPDSPEARLVGGPIHERVDRVRLANPITYVRSDAPPFLLLHGDDDTIVPIGQSVLLHQALRAAGCDATFVPLVGASHDFGADEPSWHEARRAVLAFFKRHLCSNE